MWILCAVIGHKRDARRVWNDGVDFRAACSRCGVDLIRDETARVAWRRFDAERDADEERQLRRSGT